MHKYPLIFKVTIIRFECYSVKRHFQISPIPQKVSAGLSDW
jgi:hypothetical protein